jgi:hypothetical protein
LSGLLCVGFVVPGGPGLAAALALRRSLAAPGSGAVRRLAPGAFYAGGAVGLYVVMPGHPDPTPRPDVVRPCRRLSPAGLLVFWGGLGVGLALPGRRGGAPGLAASVGTPVARRGA